jgi:hypothetical protein
MAHQSRKPDGHDGHYGHDTPQSLNQLPPWEQDPKDLPAPGPLLPSPDEYIAQRRAAQAAAAAASVPTGLIIDIVPPICVSCKHFMDYQHGAHGAEQNTGICTAFPQGIPLPIWRSRVDHRKPVADDHGIQFEPMGDEGAAYASQIFDKKEP